MEITYNIALYNNQLRRTFGEYLDEITVYAKKRGEKEEKKSPVVHLSLSMQPFLPMRVFLKAKV